MKVVAFAASSSRNSINRRLVTYAAGFLDSAEVEILDLNDYEMPLFSVDREAELGQPQQARDFLARIAGADALLIALAEHNGSYTVAWKNLFDWCSRIETRVYQDKPMVLLSTSPGPRGAAMVMETTLKLAPWFGGEVRANLSIPSFDSNFDSDKGELKDPELKDRLVATVSALLE